MMSERDGVVPVEPAGEPVAQEKKPSDQPDASLSGSKENGVTDQGMMMGGHGSVTSVSHSSAGAGAGKEGDEDDLEEQERRLEARRAYNRMNAARARKRTKDRISDLCVKVEEQAGINAKLQKTNKELIQRVDRLTEENRDLRRIAMETRGFKLAAQEGAMSPNMIQQHQQLPASLVNVSGLLPLLQQNHLLGCFPGNGIPQLLSPADQQRLLRSHAGLQDLPHVDQSSALQQASLFLQQNALQQSQTTSLAAGQDTQQNGQYFDLLRSVLAGKLANEAPKEFEHQLEV